MAARKLLVTLFSAKPSGVRTIPRAHFIAFLVTANNISMPWCARPNPSQLFGATASLPIAPHAVPKSNSKENTNANQQR